MGILPCRRHGQDGRATLPVAAAKALWSNHTLLRYVA